MITAFLPTFIIFSSILFSRLELNFYLPATMPMNYPPILTQKNSSWKITQTPAKRINRIINSALPDCHSGAKPLGVFFSFIGTFFPVRADRRRFRVLAPAVPADLFFIYIYNKHGLRQKHPFSRHVTGCCYCAARGYAHSFSVFERGLSLLRPRN